MHSFVGSIVCGIPAMYLLQQVHTTWWKHYFAIAIHQTLHFYQLKTGKLINADLRLVWTLCHFYMGLSLCHFAWPKQSVHTIFDDFGVVHDRWSSILQSFCPFAWYCLCNLLGGHDQHFPSTAFANEWTAIVFSLLHYRWIDVTQTVPRATTSRNPVNSSCMWWTMTNTTVCLSTYNNMDNAANLTNPAACLSTCNNKENTANLSEGQEGPEVGTKVRISCFL